MDIHHYWLKMEGSPSGEVAKGNPKNQVPPTPPPAQPAPTQFTLCLRGKALPGDTHSSGTTCSTSSSTSSTPRQPRPAASRFSLRLRNNARFELRPSVLGADKGVALSGTMQSASKSDEV
ncbi:uncharacterized protein LOC141914176 [Tubulanus polymorphus]|uniref:uncharacterized protein LOC141914176 n=1 Tax=Tubulanus polymorphus TaxID=672921 RepID=UPI003DA65802